MRADGGIQVESVIVLIAAVFVIIAYLAAVLLRK